MTCRTAVLLTRASALVGLTLMAAGCGFDAHLGSRLTTTDAGHLTLCAPAHSDGGRSQEIEFGLDYLDLTGHEAQFLDVTLNDVHPTGSLEIDHRILVSGKERPPDGSGIVATAGAGEGFLWRAEGWIDASTWQARVPAGHDVTDGSPLHSTEWQVVLGVRLHGQRAKAGSITVHYRSNDGSVQTATGHQSFAVAATSTGCNSATD